MSQWILGGQHQFFSGGKKKKKDEISEKCRWRLELSVPNNRAVKWVM